MMELDERIDRAIKEIHELEHVAYAAGLRRTVGAALISAHSELLRAKHLYQRKVTAQSKP